MSFDGLFTHAMVRDLNAQFAGSTIRRIQQPNRHSVIFTIRSHKKNYKLLLTIDPNMARLQLTEQSYVNPEAALNFLMVLRKYIDGARIEAIRQFQSDRIVFFDLIRQNEIGDEQPMQLVLELMGRHSNLFLIDQEHRIIDTLKHVALSQNRMRPLIPGATYQFPPLQTDKRDPFEDSADRHAHVEAMMSENETITSKVVQAHWIGFGKDSARELSERLYAEPAHAVHIFDTFIAEFDRPQPTLTYTTDGKWHFHAIDYQSVGGDKEHFETLGGLLDSYYAKLAHSNKISELSDQLDQVIKHHLKHNRKKQQNLTSDLAKSEKADDYRVKGEVLSTYLYQIDKGSEQVSLPNFYNNNEDITIALDPARTPSDNAQRYFKRYRKLQNSKQYIEREMAKVKDELIYFESLETQLAQADGDALEDMQSELIDGGYIKQYKRKAKKQPKASKPRAFKSSAGHAIYVGRNNRQNDYLTHREANREHYWFHAKNIPGSHVILATDQPTYAEIEEAAKYAAYFSKYRYSANVPVDYTQVKDVKKPNGAKPGFVNYFNQQTVYVTPDRMIDA